jgi:tetratricopeptide (TPR) repeat protein
MLTGERPNKEVVAPSKKVHIDVRLDEIVLRALEKTPELRYQTAGEFRTVLETVVQPPQSPGTSQHSAFIKSDRGRIAWQDSMASPMVAPSSGTIELFTDKLVVTSGAIHNEIPLASIQALQEAVPPVWWSPGGHRYLAVDYDDGGMQKRIAFQAGAAVLRFVGDTKLSVAEWLSAIQRAVKSATGREIEASPGTLRLPLAVTPISFLWLLLLVPLCVPLLGAIASGAAMSRTESLLASFSVMLLPLLILSGVLIVRAASMHRRVIQRTNAENGRFSRTAIVGACWAFLGILHFIFPALGYRMKSEFVPILMSVIALSAPFGVTILGWVAVRQIRRSAGKLHGLGLAVFDGMFFPLLIPVVAVAFTIGLLMSELEMGSPKAVHAYALALLVCAPLFRIIIRRVWRKMNGGGGPASRDASAQTKPAPVPESRSRAASVANDNKSSAPGKWALGLFIGAVAGFPVLWGIMGAQEVIVLCGLALLVSFVLGLMSWRSNPGKFATLASGLGLLLLAAFTFTYIKPRHQPSTITVPVETNRVKFSFSHPEALVGGHELTIPANHFMAHWVPSTGQPLSLTNNRQVITRVRSFENTNGGVVAQASCSSDGVNWETRETSLNASAPKGKLSFRDGTEATVELLGEGITGLNLPPDLSFEPVIERDLPYDDQGLPGSIDLDTGKTPRKDFSGASISVSTDGRVSGDQLVVIERARPEDWDELSAHQLVSAMSERDFTNFTSHAPGPAGPLGVWMFKTRRGKMGILQIASVTNHPTGVKIRYKLVQHGFIDQVVPNVYARGLQGVQCFDFESNRFHTPPEALADELLGAVSRAQSGPPLPWYHVSPALIGWLDETGVDVVAASYDSGAELLSLCSARADNEAHPKKGSLAETDSSQAPTGAAKPRVPEDTLTLARIAYLYWPRQPKSLFYGFMTREGNRGDLQITGITDDGFRDVKIRYKLAQSETPVKPAAAAPQDEPAAPETSAVDGSWGDHFKHGDIRRAQDGLEDALTSYRRSLEVARNEIKQRPDDAAVQALGQRRIKKSHTRIGDVLCILGDLVGAFENYRAGMAGFEPLVRGEPADEELRNELAALYVKIGDVLQAQGDKAGALAAYRKAQEVEYENFRTWEEEFIQSIGGSYNPTIPFKPGELRQLAAKPESEMDEMDYRHLAELICRAGAEKDSGFRYLLEKPELRKDEEVNLALIAYDYSINGNPKALDELLSKLAKEKTGSDSSVAATLAFVDEWDRVPKAMKAHFVGADGSGGDLKGICMAWRAYLFPRHSLQYEGKAGEGAPVDITKAADGASSGAGERGLMHAPQWQHP